MSGSFIIRKATPQDVNGIAFVMEQAKKAMPNPQWFVADGRPWIEEHITGHGFTMVATAPVGGAEETIAFFMVAFPKSPETNLGFGFLEENRLGMVAHMDSAAVLPAYRGHHLQGRLLEEAEKELARYPQKYLFCTVHPDNQASLHTMQRHGYVVVGTKTKYGGLLRHVLFKEKEAGEGAPRPNVLVSACLLGVHCRYNGKGVLEGWIKDWIGKVNWIPACPETLGGLATPRDPAERQGERVVTATGTDVTCQYQKGAREALALARVFGCRCAVLKERSPSCGHGVIYDGTHTKALAHGDGVTAEWLKAHGIAVFGESEEKKLKDFMDGRVDLW